MIQPHAGKCTTSRTNQKEACTLKDLAAFAVAESFGNLPTWRSTAAAMISEHVCMWWRRSFLVGLVLAAGCTKPNPRSCADGTCTDPAFPFCDVGGELSGTPKQCIAVTCNPGEVDLCRGDQAVTCNAEGTDYDIVRCDLGCDESIGGCRLCEPNQTACTNGTVATCDANGAVTASEDCPLDCYEDEPRCREINPSNDLATYLDMVQDPPDLDLSNAYFNTKTGELKDGDTVVSVPHFYVPSSPSGTPIRVFVASTVKIRDGYAGDKALDPYGANPTGPAFALVARGDISISGTMTIPTSGGGMIATGCVGGILEVFDYGATMISSGGGGGGHATAGGAGGSITGEAIGGAGGLVAGAATLVPLRGGCAGGSWTGTDFGSPGGGAVQLSSRTKITISGVVDVHGVDGIPVANDGQQIQHTVLYGSGAGGGILLEAPVVELGAAAQLVARGGVGAGCSPPTSSCGAGGNGATSSQPATSGGSLTRGGVSGSFAAGSGGGGLGRIRINTRDETYVKVNTTVEDGLLTTGVVSTR